MKNIFLIHGWNHLNYSKFGGKDCWANRNNFIECLAVDYKIIKLNLPGFCGEPEPNKNWDLDDYADFFQQHIINTGAHPDYVLGYSFGGAVAVRWKIKYGDKTKIILVSPAITRAYEKRREQKTISFWKKIVPKFISKILRHFYLMNIVKNPFYVNGTSFLRNSYLSIVKIDLSQEIKEIRSGDMILIFGENDTATPPNIFLSRIGDDMISKRVRVIKGGGHDIANTHCKEIIEYINNF
jgi:pimeloyl-ACP methyl ester carboxylesterase